MTRRHPRASVAIVVVVAAALLTVGAALARAGGGAEPRHGANGARAKNVIIVVGDGMSQAHRNAIQLATVGLNGRLAMDRLPVTGTIQTDPADPETVVTDSAAAATALFTGVKTFNGAIGVDPEGNPVENLAEVAKRAGKSVGIVTTSQVTDATPGALAAHVETRRDQSEIARQLIEEATVDVILGGGEDWWYPPGNPGAHPDNPPTDPSEESRGTKGNLVERAVELGYQYVTNRAELEAATERKVLGLFANEEMFEHRREGRGDIYAPDPALVVMTREAIELLSRNRRGFLLLVEEEGVDAFPHRNNGEKTLVAGRALDEAVARARTFAERHGKTLLLVTGDHETGGLTIEEVAARDESGDLSPEDGPFPIAGDDRQFVMDWTTTGHTALDILLTASGPGAHRLAGVHENTFVYDAVRQAMSPGRDT